MEDLGDDGEPNVVPHALDTEEEILQVVAFIQGDSGPIDPPPPPDHIYIALFGLRVRNDAWGTIVGSLPAGSERIVYEIKGGQRDGKLYEFGRISRDGYAYQWVCLWWGDDTYMVLK
jgi:hypothetical protein